MISRAKGGLKQGGKRLTWIAVNFLVISSLTRVGLALFSGETFTLHEWALFMGTGVIFDAIVVPCFLLPWALYQALLPGFVITHPVLSLWENRWAGLWATLFLSGFIFNTVAEFLFWAEFGSRFDFIAVDYLIYTHEVLGNIWESYPVIPYLSAIFAVSFLITWLTWPRAQSAALHKWTTRWARVGAVTLILAATMGLSDHKWAQKSPSFPVQQLSTNGLFAFGHAFWNNELNYVQYYPSLDDKTLNSKIRALVSEENAQFSVPEGIRRTISPRHPRRDVNIVLITVESLSANFMVHFGETQILTPELDKLADQGLFFTNLYATGTRTVRGLEALSISTPPTPGQSIVRRPGNDNLENIGEELKEAGWNPYWIYGGYGFFDNMNAYFESNGYAVVDRRDMDSEGIPIHHENVWGVADEDLFSLAMKKIDQEYEKGNRIFAQVMTTSNHRPYTFPENRVDLPQKKREGAVKYTDWAIGDFIKRSAKKPWFDNTLFIIVADHTSKAAGKSDLPPSRYLIPMIWYAPKLIEPATMDRLMSQIDIVPSLLSWLGLKYNSTFFGYDIFNLEPGRERAFISTYQKLGYLKGRRLVVLNVNKDPVVQEGLPAENSAAVAMTDQELIDEAIVWYQAASEYFSSGLLKDNNAYDNY